MVTRIEHSVPDSVSVGTTSTIVLATNKDRKYALIANDGSVKAYLGFGTAAILGKGMFIDAGGHYEMTPEILETNVITAIVGSGTTTITVQEATA